MLYKKFHRNFVRKFKKGTEFSYKTSRNRDTYRDTVRVEPYALTNFHSSRVRVESNENDWILTLVFENGIINKYLHAIQEIS